MDIAIIENGVVTQVARGGDPSWFGPNPPGTIVSFDPALRVTAGQLWDGVTLSNPEPATPPVRRLIPKSVVLQRVKDEGGPLLSNVFNIMYASTVEARDALTRWNMPGHNNVYFDDPDTLAVLTLTGATAEQIERIMAVYPPPAP